MSRQIKLRLGLAVTLAWLCSALWALMVQIPEAALIGQRPARFADTLTQDFTSSNVSQASKALENAILWGTQRDGSPIPQPASPEEAKKKVEWRLVASAIRPKERYILIRIGQDQPVPVKEGETLPDGSRLLKIGPKSISLSMPGGERRSLPTVID